MTAPTPSIYSDRIYEALMATHTGLSDAESAALNARLVLLLANEVADPDRLTELFVQARAAADG